MKKRKTILELSNDDSGSSSSISSDDGNGESPDSSPPISSFRPSPQASRQGTKFGNAYDKKLDTLNLEGTKSVSFTPFKGKVASISSLNKRMQNKIIEHCLSSRDKQPEYVKRRTKAITEAQEKREQEYERLTK